MEADKKKGAGITQEDKTPIDNDKQFACQALDTPEKEQAMAKFITGFLEEHPPD